MASTKGCLIIDKHGGCQLRVGDDALLLPISAMAYWNSKLVVGCGSAAGDQGNLAYFDKTVHNEMPAISGGSYGTDTVIASEFRTKMEDLGQPDVAKVLKAVTVVYYDNTAWNSMTMTLQYRFAKVTTSASVAGGNSSTTSWTTVSGSAITLDVQSGVSYKTINVGSDPGLAFQLRVTANGYLEIVGLIMHLEVQTSRQQ
jgi:hypothetical protein